MNNSHYETGCTDHRPLKRCTGCAEANGCPSGKACWIQRYIAIGGMEKYLEFKQKLIDEFNSLNIPGMPAITNLHALNGSFANLKYELPNGLQASFLDDNSIYLGNQLECALGGEQCYGIVAGMDFLLVCTYGENGSSPELILYRKR